MKNINSTQISVKPFLRWAGGKNWLIKSIHNFLPNDGFNNYHEPFLGGGSVFFNLSQSGKAFLSDLNEELINTYEQVQQNVEGIIEQLREFKNNEDCYYETRDVSLFTTSESKAARFIFLNQTSFNGIYRVNLEGRYNVPFGFRSKNFLEPENLRLVSQRLEKAVFRIGDFSECIKYVKKNDLVFLDPPYTITHNNNGFFKYNQKLFDKKD